jgi:hypothetical protein
MKNAQINFNSINNKVLMSSKLQSKALEIITENIESKKNEFISEFDNHPVTQEIENGNSSSNISGTLGGYGNLFSFIGFKIGDNPILNVRNLLKNIRVIKKITIRNKMISFDVYVPTLDDFANKTKMPWQAGRSWLIDMEKYISGIGSYLYKKYDKGRSKTGLQSNFDYSSRSFQGVRYFSTMYKNFLLNLNK